MKLVALFGLAAGGVLALGNLSAAQWHAASAGLLALALRYGLTVSPWVLAFVFAGLWWRQRDVTAAWRAGYSDQVTYYAARLTEQQQAAARRPQRRKRAAR